MEENEREKEDQAPSNYFQTNKIFEKLYLLPLKNGLSQSFVNEAP